MRTIDADSFDQMLEEAEVTARKNRKYVLASALNTVRGNLKAFPTKEGGWQQTPADMESGDIHCNYCGTKFDYYLVHQLAMESCNTQFPIHCPYCGAFMTGRVKHEKQYK